MKAKLVSFSVVVLVMVVLFFALSSLASGQGPVLTTLPTPTPVFPGSDVGTPSGPISAQALPDLVVDSIETDPVTPSVGHPTVISVTIKNQGLEALSEGHNFLTDLYIDPPFEPIVNYHQIISPALGLPWGAQWFFVPPGGSYVFTTTWVFTDVKTFDIWAQVDSNGENEFDSDGDIAEGNEDNNTKNINVSVLSAQSFTHDVHQDFMTNMASTLDNSDPNGALRLGHFSEPPFYGWPFSNGCEITPNTVTISDYNMENPDARVNDVLTGKQVGPHLVAYGDGTIIAVWQDGRHGDIYNRDIYLRYSTDEGLTWGSEIRVNDDPIGNHVNQLNPVAALSEDGDLLVAWQDRRSGLDYDIYAQRFVISGTAVITSGGNMLVGGEGSITAGDQVNPDIAVDEAGGFYVTWQDSRNNNDDIFATTYIPDNGGYTWTLVRQVNDDDGAPQQNPKIQVLDWLEPTQVTYTVAPTAPYTVTVTGVISQPAKILVVTWEDYRQGYADIAMAVSADGGETFGFDGFITNSLSDGHQQKPDVTLTKGTSEINFGVPLPDDNQTDVEVEVPVSEIHTVWEGHNAPGSDGDIYYNASQLAVEQVGDSNAFQFILNLGSENQQINQNDARNWQSEPPDQRDPSLVAVPCGEDPEEGDWNLFIVWADGRNYDSWNYDIYYTVKSTCEGMPDGLAANQMLNDGIRLHQFDAANPSYDDYDPGSPPPGYQVKPSVAADIKTNWPFVLGGYLYLAWQDDRAGDHQIENDIYFARSNLTFFNQSQPYGAGSYISDVLDSESEDTTWYTIDWSAATAASTYVTVQTRLGDTIGAVLASDWYPQRFPFQPQSWDCSDGIEGDESGAPIPGYDAPGQHIEDAAGDFWPQARYIQYRVNFFTRDSTKTPELNNLSIHFDRNVHQDDDDDQGTGTVSFTFLPIVLK
jgi:hypothetical protein